MRALAVCLLAVGVAGCGIAREEAAPRPPERVLDRPITFTTELAPLPPGLPSTTAATVPPTTTATATVPATAASSPAPAATGRTACRAVAHIGDSTSVGMTSAAVIRDPRKRLDAQYARVGVSSWVLETSGGRSIVERLPNQQNGFEVASRLRSAGFSGCWVVALGTCDAANVAKGSRVSRAQRIDRMMSVIGTDPVLWVDVATAVQQGVWADRHMQSWNQDLVSALARHPNARIWRSTAQMQPSWYASDGVHYTAAGYTARAALVADALATSFPG